MGEISNLIKETYRAQTYATARRNICTGENCKRYAVCLHIGLLYNKKKSILRSIAIDFCVRFRYYFFFVEIKQDYVTFIVCLSVMFDLRVLEMKCI